MAGTLNIPTTTLTPGTYEFPVSGGYDLADTDTWMTLTIDRTVPGGLNSVTSAVRIDFQIDESLDGGTTWQEIVVTWVQGGLYTGKFGQLNSNQVATTILPGTGRQGRATITVSGGTIALAGTLVLS